MRSLFFIVLIVFLSGCNPLRPEQLKLPEPPKNYSFEQSLPGTNLTDQWWADFHDPQLNQLEQQLFSGNLDIRQAIYRLQQLKAVEQISQSRLWPQLNLNGSVSRDHAPSLPNDSTSTSKRLSIAAAYEIDLWDRLEDTAQAAELRFQAGESDTKTLLLSLSAQLADQYFLAVEQRAQLDLLSQQQKQKQQLLQIFTSRYRAGLTTATEVYKARQNLAIVETQMPDRKAALVRAENTIALLLGQPPGAIKITANRLPQLDNFVDIGLPADLLLRRPDVIAATQQLAAADHDLAAALAARLPALNLTAALGVSATHLSAGDIEGSLWSLAMGLTQPLIDGGRRKAESQRQQAIRQEKYALWQKTFLTALQDVETALVSETNSRKKGFQLEKQRKINAQTSRLTANSYLNGLTDSQDLLLSQITQLEILSQQISNQRSQLSQRISLARALGGSWMAAELDKQQTIIKRQDEKHD